MPIRAKRQHFASLRDLVHVTLHAEARRLESVEIHLTEAATSIGGGIGPGTVTTPVVPDAEYLRATTKRSKGYIDDAVAHMKVSRLRLRKRVLRDSWSVPRSITDYATNQRVDLVVVGGSSVRGLKRYVLGSVSNGVVNNASTSVLVVR